MEPSRFSNVYDNVTTLHPVGVALLLAALLAIFLLRRDWIFLPIMLVTCLVPASQRVVILGFDFHFLRLLTLFGWIRIWTRGEAKPLRWNTLDKLVVAWAVAGTLTYFLRKASFSALVNGLGQAFDGLGLYLLARTVIRDWRDLETLVRSFSVASIVVTVFALREITTGRNPFSFYGSVPELAIVREGSIRLRGVFSHQILAGCYWVVPAILCAGALIQKRGRIVLPAIGLACSLFLVIASSSSTPFLGLGLGVVAACMWPIREHMRTVRWGLVAALVVAQLAMAKPIWHLYQRVTVFGVGGSTGYHRYRLIDAFVSHFKQWALLGVNSTGPWGRQLEDVTNHFIGQGVRSGLVGFLLFIAIFVYAYIQVGAVRKAWSADLRRSAFAWALGVGLFAQTMMMTATSYFGQILLVLWVTLGAIGSLTPSPPRRRPTRRARSRPARSEVQPRGVGLA